MYIHTFICVYLHDYRIETMKYMYMRDRRGSIHTILLYQDDKAECLHTSMCIRISAVTNNPGPAIFHLPG